MLWRIHEATVLTTLYAIALTSLIAFLVGARKKHLWPTLEQVKDAAKKGWSIGKSLLVANQFQWVGSQGILLIVAATSGINAASGIRAVITLLGPVSVLYQLLDNVIPVRAARAFVAGGTAGLQAYLRRAGLLLLIMVGVPVLLIVVLQKPVMTLAFGKSFTAYAPLVTWQAV